MTKKKTTKNIEFSAYKDTLKSLSETEETVLRSPIHFNEVMELDDQKATRPFTNINFTCAATQEKLIVPCGLTSCRYFLNYEWSNNCLLAYAQQQGTDKLTPEEISYLYSVPIDKVNKSIEKSLNKLRREIMVAEAESDSDLQPQFQFVETKRVCCVCASPIESKKDRIDIRDLNLAYCSSECMDQIGPYAIALEYRMGLPIKKILTWVMKRFKSLALVEKTLGVPKWAIYEMCLTFLGRDIKEFFPDAKDVVKKKKTLYKLNDNHHQFLTKSPEYVHANAKSIYAYYGNPTILFETLSRELQEVLGI